MTLSKKQKNKGADQTAQMPRLVSACVVRKPRRQVFSRHGPYHFDPFQDENSLNSYEIESSL